MVSSLVASSDSLDFSIGSMIRENGGKEAHVKMKDEPEGREVREEMRRSAAKVGRCGVAFERECAIEWMNDL